MNNIEQARELKAKALGILQNKGIPSAIAWLMDEDFGKSPKVQIDKSRTERDFEDCQKVKRFKFNKHFYELFFEKERGSSYPDGVYTEEGEFRLLFDGEEVFKACYTKNYPDDEWGSIDYTIWVHELLTKKIKIKQWVDDLPKLVELEKDLKKQEQEKWEKEEEEKKAKEIFQNIELGKYRKSNDGANLKKVEKSDGWLISCLKFLGGLTLLLIGGGFFIKGAEIGMTAWQVYETILSPSMILPAGMVGCGWFLISKAFPLLKLD